MTRNPLYHHSPPAERPADSKLVEMAIQPTHGILDSHVQIPKGISGRYQNFAPD